MFVFLYKTIQHLIPCKGRKEGRKEGREGGREGRGKADRCLFFCTKVFNI